MLKKIISLLLVLCLLGSLVGCGGGNPVIPSYDEDSGDDFIYIQDTNLNDNVLVIAGKEDGEVVTILGEKDASGNPIEITDAMYISEQGDALIIDAGDDGLPTFIIDSAGNKVAFENYTDSSVEISIYNSNEELLQGPTTIAIDPSDLTTLKQLYGSIKSKNKYIKDDAALINESLLKYGGLAFSVLACAVTFSSGIPLLIAKVCASTLVSALVTFSPGTLDNWVTSSIGALSCLGTLILPWEILACAGAIVSLVSLVYEGLTVDNEKEVLKVLDKFDNAIVNLNWSEAKSCCVVGSEAYNAVDEFKDLYAQLDTLCDDITMSISNMEIIDVNIDLIYITFAEVTRSYTFTIACIPLGNEEEVMMVGEGEETINLEKVENSWKLKSGELLGCTYDIIEPKLKTFRK